MTVLELVRGTGRLFSDEITANGGYERGPDTFHLRFDPESESVAHALVRAAAFVHNVDQTDLEPLGQTVDPDALGRVLGLDSEKDAEYVSASFTYEGLEITVDSDGNIWLRWA